MREISKLTAWALYLVTVYVGLWACAGAVLQLVLTALRHPRKLLSHKAPPCPQHAKAPEMGTHEFFKAGPVKLHYVRRGTGSKLMLFIHGFPQNWYAWRHQMQKFAGEEYTTVAVDLRGYGESDKPAGMASYHIRAVMEDMALLIRHLAMTSVTVVGHDWGGIVAWHLCALHPDLVEKLVILNMPHPSLWIRNMSLAQLRRGLYVAMFHVPFISEILLRCANYNMLRRALQNGPKNHGSITNNDADVYLHFMGEPGALSAALNYYRAIFPGNAFCCPTVSTPTLHLFGVNDTAIGEELNTNTRAVVPNLTYIPVPDCSHWIQEDQPSVVNDYIDKFVHGRSL